MTNSMLADLRVIDVADVLSRLAPGVTVDLSPQQQAVLDLLVSAGLVSRAPDLGASRAALDAKKDALARTTDPQTIAKLRLEVLTLSESLASADGAATVRSSVGEGPYRSAGAADASYVVTQAGRALLSNLGPRAARAPELAVTDFGQQLAALELLFAARARRAAEMVQRMQSRTLGGLPAHAIRSASIGLASLPESPETLADAFLVLYPAIRTFFSPSRMSEAQDASAAESLILHAGSSSVAYQKETAQAFVEARDDLTRRFCAGRSEDALDAMLLLASFSRDQHEPRIQRAARFATEMGRAGVTTPLSIALFVTVADEGQALVPAIVRAYGTLCIGTSDVTEALAAAALIAGQSVHGLDTQLARVRELHGYLSRIAPEGMLVGAALLGLLDGEPAGLLDDLRLTSKHVQEQRLAPGGAEATTLALKMLLHSALLARGSEGDPEESLALAARALPDVAPFSLGTQGLGTMSATLPMLTSSIAVFHRPMLDAAVIYEQHSRPMHSDYVFGGGTNYGAGASSSGSSYGNYHHTSHRSFGWG